MNALPREVAHRQPANLPVQRPVVIEGKAWPSRSVTGQAASFLWKFLAILLLTAGMAGYLLASMQTV
jgi:hypothetical protein